MTNQQNTFAYLQTDGHEVHVEVTLPKTPIDQVPLHQCVVQGLQCSRLPPSLANYKSKRK